LILDATCGSRMMWFEKDDPETVYLDIRRGRFDTPTAFNKQAIIEPTVQADNRALPFKDDVFDLVLFDPSHHFGRKARLALHIAYGFINPYSWHWDINLAAKEFFRVLRPGGFLVFKWSSHDIPLKKVLPLIPAKPLFGSKTLVAERQSTHWIIFRKDHRSGV